MRGGEEDVTAAEGGILSQTGPLAGSPPPNKTMPVLSIFRGREGREKEIRIF
jgi:hypothetical protein